MQKTLHGFFTPRVGSSQEPTPARAAEKEERPYGDWETNAEETRKENLDPNTPQALHCGKSSKQSPPNVAKKVTQMFLDCGQRDFAASKCPKCGMIYAKGHKDDEQLHKSCHRPAFQAIGFQGWPGERVLLTEAFIGRLIMVQSTDPVSHVKKVQEVCASIEQPYGMTSGWLLRVDNWKVFLYVSTTKKVLGVVVAEPIKYGYVVASPVVAEEVDSKAKSSRPPQTSSPASLAEPSSKQLQQEALSRTQQPELKGGTNEQQHQQQGQKAGVQQEQELEQTKQRRCLMWPGLHKRRCLQHMTTSSGSAATYSKAYSCPSRLVAAAGRLRAVDQPGAEAAAATAAGGAGTEGIGNLTSALAIAANAAEVTAAADEEARDQGMAGSRQALSEPFSAAAAATTAGGTGGAGSHSPQVHQTDPVSRAECGAGVSVAVAEASAPSSPLSAVERTHMDWQRTQEQQGPQHSQAAADQQMEQWGVKGVSAGGALYPDAAVSPTVTTATGASLPAAVQASSSAVADPTEAATAAPPPLPQAPVAAAGGVEGAQVTDRQGLGAGACVVGALGLGSISSSSQQVSHPASSTDAGPSSWSHAFGAQGMGGGLQLDSTRSATVDNCSSSSIQGLPVSWLHQEQSRLSAGSSSSRKQGPSSHIDSGAAVQRSSGHDRGSGSSKAKPWCSSSRLQNCSKGQRVPLADKERPVKALIGVRMVWVSQEHRRKGIATKLLDAARCNMVLGYVVPRNQLAFTQPTEQGTQLAAAFTGTGQFLVYGV